MKITRKNFVEQFQDQKVSVQKVQNDPNLSRTMKRKMARADLNRDGFISGEREAEKLFKEVDRYDRNGDRNSISTNNRNVFKLHQALTGAVEQATPAADTGTTSSQDPLGQLLSDNPGIQSNQDLLNYFMRRNRNNWSAAASEAKDFGVSLNALSRNRRGRPHANVSTSTPTPSTSEPTPVDSRPSFGPIGRVRGAGRTSRAFRQKVTEIAERLQMDPTHLMAVMSFESGETFSPSIRNRYTNATGLIQFMPRTARRMGTTTGKLAAMTPERQLDYVERYLRPYKGKMNTVEDAYMAVLWPAAVGKGPNYALFRNPSKAYRQNRGLDTNRNGVVTAREAASKVRAKMQ